MSDVPTPTARDELRTVPLSAIRVQDGFNPRRQFDERELDRLAKTIAQTGVLQPLRVRPAATPGEYELIAGERRYRAAFKAGLTEIPVTVRAAAHDGNGELGEQDLLEAATENFHRAAHTPVEEALIFERLRSGGLTQRGIADKLAVSRELVRERLAILALPEDLYDRVDDGTIPLGAVPALVRLAGIHPGLPAVAICQVTMAPAESWRRPMSWAEVIEDPIAAVCVQYHGDESTLPAGVFQSGSPYPLSAFALGEQGDRDLAALVKLNPGWGSEDARVIFDGDLVEQAAALQAAHASTHGYSTLIVGQEVADQLAADAVRAQLKAERARARREREQRKHQAEAGGQDGEAAVDENPEARRQQEELRRRAERDADRQARAAAQAFNLELGAAVLKTFAKVKLDGPVVQILSAVDFRDDLFSLVARGARYGFPGWPLEETTKTGKTKTVYLEGRDAASKASEFLAGASSAGEYAGRCVSLVVMAVLADEACVARSNRAGFDFYGYKPSVWGYEHADGGLPWQREVVGLVEDLALERLPEHLTARVRDTREQARRKAEEQAGAEAAAQAAERALRIRLEGMAPDERTRALEAFGAEHGAYGDRWWNLRGLVEQLNTPAADEPEQDTSAEPPVENPAAVEDDRVPEDAVDEPVDGAPAGTPPDVRPEGDAVEGEPAA